MATLYIDRKNTQLKTESNVLIQYVNDKRRRNIPLKYLERIVITAPVQLDTNVLLKIAEAGVQVSIINPRKIQQQALLQGSYPKNPHLRFKQYQLSNNEAACKTIAQAIVQTKIRKHIHFYKKLQKKRQDLHLPITKTIQQLKQARENALKDNSLDSLRGIEGSAAKTAFACYKHLFAESLGFTGRNRRPPKDPVNACLSLTFTLVHHRIAQQLYANGLDPMLGFLHEAKYSRDSLASDCIEIWRPDIEAWVWRLFKQQYLTSEHFSQSNEGCLLNKTGRKRFYPAFENFSKPLKRAVRWQIRQSIKRYETLIS